MKKHEKEMIKYKGEFYYCYVAHYMVRDFPGGSW